MKIYPPNAEFSAIEQKMVDGNLWSQILQSNNLLIPIELNTKDKTVGLFVFDHHNLPVGGQKFLFEIAGSPFTPELAGVKVFFSPIVPALQKNYEKALIMLADSIDKWDGSTHSHETSIWAEQIAKHMGFAKDEVQRIKLAAKLHDIGKAVVPREILTKPGPLCKEEWEIIRQHPGYGATLMEPAQCLDEIRPLVHSHHEHYCGDGYPDGLSGEQIPIGARIISVADAFSTMTIRRVYRTPVSIEIAKNELVRCLGTQFDPLVVDHMLEILAQPSEEKYLPGNEPNKKLDLKE